MESKAPQEWLEHEHTRRRLRAAEKALEAAQTELYRACGYSDDVVVRMAHANAEHAKKLVALLKGEEQ